MSTTMFGRGFAGPQPARAVPASPAKKSRRASTGDQDVIGLDAVSRRADLGSGESREFLDNRLHPREAMMTVVSDVDKRSDCITHNNQIGSVFSSEAACLRLYPEAISPDSS